MSVYRKSLKCRLSYLLLAGAAIILFLTAVFIHELNEHIDEITEYKCRETARAVMVSAAASAAEEIDGADYYVIEKDSKGSVTSVRADPAVTERLCLLLSEKIEEELDKLSQHGISIPIGTLMGSTLLSGKGSSISIDVTQLGVAETIPVCEVESAGINQTLLRMKILITVRIRAVLPDKYIDTESSYELPVCETLVVGDVPCTYFST
ncbi:MAG: hypothetical protein IJ806_05330 [Ruminococcus sp.]|nr:hypothetical protein [Ruminococcus sp.]